MLCSCSTTYNEGSNHNASESYTEGSGNLKTEQRNLPRFKALILSTPANMSIELGKEPQSVTLSFDDNLLPLIKTSVDEDTLKISGWSLRSRNRLQVRIVVADLRSVELLGAGNIEINNLKGKSFHASMNGAGNIKARGKIDSAQANLAGAGKIDFGELEANDVSTTVEGAGVEIVNVSQSLNANIIGSGTIKYTGSPTNIKQNIIGSGSIERE